MDKAWPWVRSVVGFVLGAVAIQLVNMAGAAVFPDAFSGIDSDGERASLTLVGVLAGIAGAFLQGAIARHRLWLHMVVFGLAMLAVDIAVVLGPLAAEPWWFKAVVVGAVPLQVLVGGWLAGLTWRGSRQAQRRVVNDL